MTGPTWLLVLAVFFLTAAVSVVTGGTSLITVPAMMQLGVEPHIAVATNMQALVFLSLGGTLPFVKDQTLPVRRLPLLAAMTLVGSVLGGLLLLVVPSKALSPIVAISMLSVVVFSLVNRSPGKTEEPGEVRPALEIAGYVATFLLGIYGGFFSGGYVTMLTAACVFCFRMTFGEAVAITKALNLISSLVATAIFASQGLVDWKLGVPLSVVSFLGAMLGAMLARRMSEFWLCLVVRVAVACLAVKLLIS